MRFNIFFALITTLFAVGSSAQIKVDAVCITDKEIKASIAKEWEKLPPGSELQVIKPKGKWTIIKIKDGPKDLNGKRARVLAKRLNKHCEWQEPEPPAAEAPEPAEAPAEPAAEPEAEPEAPLENLDLGAIDVQNIDAIETVQEDLTPSVAQMEPPPPPVEKLEAKITEPIAALENIAESKLVAIVEFQHGAKTEGMANALASVITGEVAGREGYRAISNNELRTILDQKAQAQLAGCESIRCMIDIAELVDADLVLSGDVQKVEGAVVITFTLFEAEGSKVLSRAETTWRGDEAEAVLLLPGLVDRLILPKETKLMGSLDIVGNIGASIYIDGQEVGEAPFKGPIKELSAGPHLITTSAEGFVTVEEYIVINKNETNVYRYELVEEPYYNQWWFWTAVGGGAAVALAVGGTFGALAIIDSLEPEPTTLRIQAPMPVKIR